ncbi:MAG: hypothetical protein L3J79_02670, partial [Candidatus Marinimicrobia bacterium]|nr:hypothetical protein [Candidatus Neomarinimicrobiota bacterium]
TLTRNVNAHTVFISVKTPLYLHPVLLPSLMDRRGFPQENRFIVIVYFEKMVGQVYSFEYLLAVPQPLPLTRFISR